MSIKVSVQNQKQLLINNKKNSMSDRKEVADELMLEPKEILISRYNPMNNRVRRITSGLSGFSRLENNMSQNSNENNLNDENEAD